MLVLAALHLAALRGHEVLGPLYASVRAGDLSDPAGAAHAVLAVLHQSPELVRDELWRSTQTNEPGRSAVLRAVLSDLLDGVASSINVIDVGTSAGINLYFDQFPVRAHDDGDALSLVCEDLTPIDRSRALPRVRDRTGIDPAPLNLANDDDRLWLKACLWPEDCRRHERFDAVVAAHASWPRATVLVGGVRDCLVDALDGGSRDAVNLVVNTWSAAYFSEDERAWYAEEVTRRCREGRTAWISLEPTGVRWPGVQNEVAPLDDTRHRGATRIVVARPGSAPRHWGWCHAHGRWLERTSGSFVES